MPDEQKKLLVVQVAALGADLVERNAERVRAAGFDFHRAETVFPALTCAVQASFRTDALPCFHGICGNGFFARKLGRPFFWEQSARLVYGRRIWEGLRGRGRRVGLMFWQQSLGEHADLILSPKPVHKHHGGMIQNCYSRPADLYARLCAELGRPFALRHYWGPLASRRSSEWIAGAVAAVMAAPDLAPDLLLAYLPHLDYDLQRHGPESPQAVRALDVLLDLLSGLRKAAEAAGYAQLIFGDYAIASVTRPPVFPARPLREAGLFQVRRVGRGTYPDYLDSAVVALADHEVALVYGRDAEAIRLAREVLSALPGVAQVLDAEAQRRAGTDDPIGPDLIAVAEEGAWFAYPWWDDPRDRPDFATHVDIHSKPGYDPCELFWGLPPRISGDPARVRGTHGRAGPDRSVAWTASWSPAPAPTAMLDLSAAVRAFLDPP